MNQREKVARIYFLAEELIVPIFNCLIQTKIRPSVNISNTNISQPCY